jgi:hypothetical protein
LAVVFYEGDEYSNKTWYELINNKIGGPSMSLAVGIFKRALKYNGLVLKGTGDKRKLVKIKGK